MRKFQKLIGAFVVGLIVIVLSSTGMAGQAIQPDGKILIWGNGNIVVSGVSLGLVARFHPNGTHDNTFSFCACGFVSINGVAVQSNGKVVFSGARQSATDPNTRYASISRVNADGSFDSTFPMWGTSNTTTNTLTVLRTLPNDTIMATSYSSGGFPMGSSLSLELMNPNGGSSFGIGVGNGNSTFTGLGGVAVTTDNKVYFSRTPAPTGPVSNPIQRHFSSGTVDGTWAPPTVAGGVLPGVYALAVQPNGNVVAGGGFSSVNGSFAPNMARLSPAGVVDTTFVYGGPTQNVYIKRIDALSDGKLLVMDSANALRRVNSDGSIDSTFTAAITPAADFTVDSLGRIYSGGTRLNPNGDVDSTFVLRLASPRSFDFDGDGKSDIGIFRPSNGLWYLQRSTAGESIQSFGINSDRVAAADYDGDGKTDVAIYRDGAWWYLNSSDSTLGLKNWGTATDIPLPSDFNADGKSDFVYYRPSTGQWFRTTAGGTTSTNSFGLATDIPLIADMDGDGRSDPTIYRPSDGMWWYRSSVSGLDTAVQWGIAGDMPVPADYDGDGKTDPAIFRPSSGDWYVLKSSGSYMADHWGLSGDSPVAADYDGDGKADLAVYRPLTGVWFIMRSTGGISGMQYGISTDVPLQNAYIP